MTYSHSMYIMPSHSAQFNRGCMDGMVQSIASNCVGSLPNKVNSVERCSSLVVWSTVTIAVRFGHYVSLFVTGSVPLSVVQVTCEIWFTVPAAVPCYIYTDLEPRCVTLCGLAKTSL